MVGKLPTPLTFLLSALHLPPSDAFLLAPARSSLEHLPHLPHSEAIQEGRQVAAP